MSRKASLWLGLIALTALAACGGESETGDRGNAAPDLTSETTPPPVPPQPGDTMRVDTLPSP